eukprot:TRINITY_DN170_c0_g1_i1.p1 TRINITY_DN170_c0_g1~~TRINITY_DN170_c0_g1_i1.p1  ORF type:complete len:507 (-),score=106.68 TRINITY_DN170_c0_g1_i1:453-1973(-)
MSIKEAQLLWQSNRVERSVNPLSLSSTINKIQPDVLVNHTEEIERTVTLGNVPVRMTEGVLKFWFGSKYGPVARIRFFPKGNHKSALVEMFDYRFQEPIPEFYENDDGTFITLDLAAACISETDKLITRNHSQSPRKPPTKPDDNLNILPREDLIAEILNLRSRVKELEMQVTNLFERNDLLEQQKQDIPTDIMNPFANAVFPDNPFGTELPNPYINTPTRLDNSHLFVNEPTQDIYHGGHTHLSEMELIARQIEEDEERKRLEEERATQALIESLLAEDEEERRRRQEEVDNRTYTCPICFDDFGIEEIYLIDGCFHRYCRVCLEMMLVSKINEGAVKKISCPDPGCGQEIEYHEVKQILVTDNHWQKYEDFLTRKSLETMENLRWCPRPDCGNAMIGDPDRPMMICPNEECRFSFCFNCKEEWHSDATCEEYQEWKIENSEAEARYQEWVEQNAKECPSCKTYIEKNGGCNHMTCKSCSHEFCWLCNADYTSGHFSNTDCTQYS